MIKKNHALIYIFILGWPCLFNEIQNQNKGNEMRGKGG